MNTHTFSINGYNAKAVAVWLPLCERIAFYRHVQENECPLLVDAIFVEDNILVDIESIKIFQELLDKTNIIPQERYNKEYYELLETINAGKTAGKTGRRNAGRS